jgi:hypothetical protein
MEGIKVIEVEHEKIETLPPNLIFSCIPKFPKYGKLFRNLNRI